MQQNEEETTKLRLNISLWVLRKNIEILKQNFKFLIWKKIMCPVSEGKWSLVTKRCCFFYYYFQGLQEAWMLEARIKKMIWEKVHFRSIEQPMRPSQTHFRILSERMAKMPRHSRSYLKSCGSKVKFSDWKNRNIMPIFQTSKKEDAWALLAHQSLLHAQWNYEKRLPGRCIKIIEGRKISRHRQHDYTKCKCCQTNLLTVTVSVDMRRAIHDLCRLL